MDSSRAAEAAPNAMPSTTRPGPRPLLPLVLLALGLIAVPVLGDGFLAYQVALFLIYGIATQGVALCWGRLGFLPLGQSLFFGLGAYCSGILNHTFGWHPLLALPAGLVTDRVDRRRLILAMDALRAVAFAGMALADSIGRLLAQLCRLIGTPLAPWTGADVPDYGPLVAPDKSVGPFIMNPEGVGRLYVRGLMREGPFPEHYEPMDAFLENPLHPKVSVSPVARIFASDAKSFGTPDKFPIVATTYRLTEHFHYWTKAVHGNAVLQPELFVEIGERLAASPDAPPLQGDEWP